MQEKENVLANTVSTIDPEEPIGIGLLDGRVIVVDSQIQQIIPFASFL